MTQIVSQYELTTQALRTRAEDLGVSKLDRLVFIQLTAHIQEDYSKGYWCNPSLRLLADELGMGAPTVAKCVETLKEKELIKVDAAREKHNNIYWINGGAISEAHQKWIESFRGRVPASATSSFGVVTKEQKQKFDEKENKESKHTRNVSGLVQNKPRVVDYQDDPECPF